METVKIENLSNEQLDEYVNKLLEHIKKYPIKVLDLNSTNDTKQITFTLSSNNPKTISIGPNLSLTTYGNAWNYFFNTSNLGKNNFSLSNYFVNMNLDYFYDNDDENAIKSIFDIIKQYSSKINKNSALYDAAKKLKKDGYFENIFNYFFSIQDFNNLSNNRNLAGSISFINFLNNSLITFDDTYLNTLLEIAVNNGKLSYKDTLSCMKYFLKRNIELIFKKNDEEVVSIKSNRDLSLKTLTMSLFDIYYSKIDNNDRENLNDMLSYAKEFDKLMYINLDNKIPEQFFFYQTFLKLKSEINKADINNVDDIKMYIFLKRMNNFFNIEEELKNVNIEELLTDATEFKNILDIFIAGFKEV